MLLKKILFLIFVLESVSGWAKSTTGCAKPTISVSLEKTVPTYASKRYSELVNICQMQNVLGCTLSAYGCTYKIHLNEKGCKQLDFKCYPEKFHVYIIDEYPKNSCEYKAIRRHENLHVSAIQNFPKESVEKYLTQCIDEEVKKKKIKAGELIYQKCVRKVSTWLNRRIEEKNDEIDSYKKYDPLYFSDCKNWKMSSLEIEAHLNMKD